ncbi:MAG: hypothetical protein F6K47_03820 [Symploca sp. SIO2E6]|nr:hypothetical protein [Symploca sp. SIO2E6]
MMRYFYSWFLGMGNWGLGIGNWELANSQNWLVPHGCGGHVSLFLDNQQPTTNNQQPTTNNQQPTTNNQQPTTKNPTTKSRGIIKIHYLTPAATGCLIASFNSSALSVCSQGRSRS